MRWGNPDAPYMVVMAAPEDEEVLEQRAFANGYGKTFNTFLKSVGIEREECYVVYTVGEPVVREEDSEDLWHDYWDDFDDAVGDFGGRVALCMGSNAFHRTTGLVGSHQDWAGYLVPPSDFGPLRRRREVEGQYKSGNKARGIKKGDPRVIRYWETVQPRVPENLEYAITFPTMGAVWRTGLSTAPLVLSPLAKAKRVIDRCLAPSRDHYETTLPEGITVPGGYFALDLEGWEVIERVGIATADGAWSVPWDDRAKRITAALMGNPELTAIIHNANFDIPFLERSGVTVRCKVWDTMFGAAFSEPDLRKGLVFCGGQNLDCVRWKPPRANSKGVVPPTNCSRLDTQDEVRYNALDTIREYELFLVQWDEFRDKGQLDLFLKMMETLPTLIRMQQRGILLDPARRAEWQKTLERKVIEESVRWMKVAPGVNPGSSPQVLKWLKSLGVKLPRSKKSKTAGESADKEALEKIRGNQPEFADKLDVLIALRDANYSLKTYAKVVAGSDGRVHPNFSLSSKDDDGTGKEIAATFRPSAKEPNLQNQSPEAQKMYICGPGKCFVAADFGSLEARLLAALSGDEVLMDDLRHDLHNRNKELLKISRTGAKISFYLWAYWGQPKTLHASLRADGFDISLKQCEELLAQFDTKYHVAAAWRLAEVSKCAALRYVENPFGYRRMFHNKDINPNQVINTKIQSTGAMMMWDRLGLLDRRLMEIGAALLLMVHDSVLVECSLEQRDAVAAIVKETLEATFNNIAPGFSCPVEIKWSPTSWGELEAIRGC